MIKILFVLLAIAIGGITYSLLNRITHSGQPAVIMCCLNPSLQKYVISWRTEIARRFPNSAVVFAHGGTNSLGDWIAEGKQESQLAAEYQHRFPDRTIVMLSCNPGHCKLGVHGVYYFPSDIWCQPDRNATSDEEQGKTVGWSEFLVPDNVNRSTIDPDTCGNIFEAVCE